MIKNACSICRPIQSLNLIQKRTSFYNRYKHGPTSISNPKPDYLQWVKDFFGKEGLDHLKSEYKRISTKPFRTCKFDKQIARCKTVIFENFDSDESIKPWKPVSDSDALNGFSSSNFSRSPSGHGLFNGLIDNQVPDDGATIKSGFAGIIGPQKPCDELFAVETFWDWTAYNTFEIKFRGDGRKYNIILNTGTYTSDLAYYDYYAYPLYTRGGPYWQTYTIPFSKFIFAYKGLVQDEQDSPPLMNIKFVSITLEDSYDGPFALEIDHMGLIPDMKPFEERSAYETYSFSHIKLRNIQVDCDPPEQLVT